MTSFDLDKLDNPPPPPRYLYKYLSAERAGDVLEGGTVRFTPLLDTNDTFEVRSTFARFAGPKMLTMLAEQMENTLSEDSLRRLTADMLRKKSLDWLPPDLAIKLADQHYGVNFMGLPRLQMQHAVDGMFVPHFNDPESAKKRLEQLGRDLRCILLSERMDSPSMSQRDDRGTDLIGLARPVRVRGGATSGVPPRSMGTRPCRSRSPIPSQSR